MKSKGCLTTSGSGDQSGEEALSPLPQPPARSRRGAVSAETYSEEDATNYVKKVRVALCVSSFFLLHFFRKGEGAQSSSGNATEEEIKTRKRGSPPKD